jgi:hypothetical protein
VVATILIPGVDGDDVVVILHIHEPGEPATDLTEGRAIANALISVACLIPLLIEGPMRLKSPGHRGNEQHNERGNDDGRSTR